MRTLVVVLLLGACAVGDTSEMAACKAEAERSPVVRELIAKGAGSPTFLAESQEELKVSRQAAMLGCLRARGAIRPGGVERQKPL